MSPLDSPVLNQDIRYDLQLDEKTTNYTGLQCFCSLNLTLQVVTLKLQSRVLPCRNVTHCLLTSELQSDHISFSIHCFLKEDKTHILPVTNRLITI